MTFHNPSGIHLLIITPHEFRYQPSWFKTMKKGVSRRDHVLMPPNEADFGSGCENAIQTKAVAK